MVLITAQEAVGSSRRPAGQTPIKGRARMRRFGVTLFACVLGGVVFPAFGQSDVIKPGEERFTFGLGAVLNAFGTDLRLDNSTLGQGSNVNLRDDFGVEKDASSFWASAEWRFAPRHRIGLNYSQFKLTGTRTALRNIQIGDETYPAGATLTSELKLEIIPIAYSYSLIKREQDELAATVGIHWSRVSFKAQGSASLSSLDASNDVTAEGDLPLPLIGLRYEHHFSQRWSAGLQGAFFTLQFGKDTLNVEGDIWSARAHAEYRFSKHFGLGLAVEGFELDVEASQGSWQGGFRYRYWGPQLYLNARF
jgi:hypothetical protein